jgi:hypothetical protein
MSVEQHFDVGFIARLTAEEKQIQQNYRPVIGVHKWFARRPGALFRGLLLAEFASDRPLAEAYLRSNSLSNVTVADPFMGGGDHPLRGQPRRLQRRRLRHQPDGLLGRAPGAPPAGPQGLPPGSRGGHGRCT